MNAYPCNNLAHYKCSTISTRTSEGQEFKHQI